MNETEKIIDDQIDAKVAFISNTVGTTLNEVLLAVLLPLLSYINYTCLFHTYISWNFKERLFEFIISNIFLITPIIFGLTVLSDHLLLIDVVLVSMILTIILWKVSGKFNLFTRCLHYLDEDTTYLSNYKAIIQVTTSFCILAVDFEIFPRRFAKAEVYGIGCMDLGVGAFIFSMALTSAPARGRQRFVLGYILKTVTSSIVLILLGSARVAIVKLSHYQEHITEYGIHWNFFITLAIVRIINVFILYMLPWFRRQFGYLLLSFVGIISYQFALSRGGLERVVQRGIDGDDSRHSLFDANREGIISCIGYLSLYYFGLFMGSQLFKRCLTSMNKIYWLATWFLASFIGVHLSVYYITPISRQMVNLSYYLVIISVNSLMLSVLLMCQTSIKTLQIMDKKDDTDFTMQSKSVSYLYTCISRKQLMYFLVGNVLTGIVNKSVNTLNAGVITSVSILSIYMLTVNSFIAIVPYLF